MAKNKLLQSQHKNCSKFHERERESQIARERERESYWQTDSKRKGYFFKHEQFFVEITNDYLEKFTSCWQTLSGEILILFFI